MNWRLLKVLGYCIVLSLVDLVVAPARAEYSVGYVEDGYSYAGQNLWAKGDTLYTRTYHEYQSYKTYYNNYGYAYQRPITYWYWNYIPQLSPKSTDAEWIAWARGREKDAAAAALKVTDHKNFMERLAVFGISPPPPGIPDNGGSSYAGRQAYLTPIQGQTAYGYAAVPFQVQQVADIFVPLNVDGAIQTQSIFSNNLLSATREVSSGINGAVGQQLATNERIALARIDADRTVRVLEASRPPSRITTTINGATIEPTTMPKVGNGDAKLPVIPGAADGPFSPRYVAAATNACISCHSSNGGKDPAGKFDMTAKVLTPEQKAKVLARVMLPITEKGHMPQGADGKPGRQMTAKEIVDLLD